MTSVDTTLNEPAPTPAALRDQMRFAAGPPRMGVEIEFHIQDTHSNEQPAPAGDERVLALKHRLRTRHDIDVDDEIAAHMVEVKTAAYELADMPALLREIGRLQRAMTEEAAALGLKPAPFGVMAGLTGDRALRNMIEPTPGDPERGGRARTMMAGIANTGMDGFLPYPLLNVSAQVSVGARDAAHLYAMIRRHNLLLPFLFTLLHNRPPAFDRHGVKTGVHTGIAGRRGLGARGLISPAFARSRDAEDYLRNVLADAYRRPMICHIDCRGQFTAAARGETVTMETLRADGRATRANALLALSMDWNSAKIKTIPGTPYLRAEMRDMDTAGHHAASLAIINGLMNMDEECGRAVDGLLAGYGYAGAGPAFSTTLDRDLARAERQAGSFMDMPYGGGRMDRFAQDFIATLAPYAARHGVAEDMRPLAHACEAGMTEARALDAILHTPQDVADFQRMYEAALLADPRTSLALRLR